jgi:hypothetical protein
MLTLPTCQISPSGKKTHILISTHADDGSCSAQVDVGATLTLTNCEISASGKAQGVVARDEGTNLTVTKCKVHGNHGGGLSIWDGARSVVTACELFDSKTGHGARATASLSLSQKTDDGM